MRYNEQLHLAATWLIAGQSKKDGGWGLNPTQGSSIVNTAEAIYVLRRAGKLATCRNDAAQFLRDAIVQHPDSRGKHLRYIAFALLGLVWLDLPADDPSILFCIKTLVEAQNPNGSWGHSFDLNTYREPRVFPTFLAIWSLQQAATNQTQEVVQRGITWLFSAQKTDGGWGLSDIRTEPSNAACTAYALMVLAERNLGDPRTQHGKTWLIEKSAEWNAGQQIGESVGGTDWFHCSTVWAIHALLDCGVSVTTGIIGDSVKHLLSLYDQQTGGWRQSINHVVNVRSIYWAVVATERVKDALDLSDVVFLGGNASSRVDIIKFGGPQLGLQSPAWLYPVTIAVIPVLCILVSTLALSQSIVSPKILEIKLTETGLKIGCTIIASMAIGLIFIARHQISKPKLVAHFLTIVAATLSLWVADNTSVVNSISLISAIISLAPYILNLGTK